MVRRLRPLYPLLRRDPGMYYLRSRSAVDAVKVTVSSEKVAKEDFIKSQLTESNEPEDCLTCSA